MCADAFKDVLPGGFCIHLYLCRLGIHVTLNNGIIYLSYDLWTPEKLRAIAFLKALIQDY